MFTDKFMAAFGVGVGCLVMIAGSAQILMWNGWPSILGGTMFGLSAMATWFLLPVATRQENPNEFVQMIKERKES